MSDTRERIPWTQDFCFHPDIAEANASYHRGDKDAFKKAGMAHHVAANEGKRITEGSEATDQYLIDAMQRKSLRYTLETGDVRPHVDLPKKRQLPKRHWTDIPLGIRNHEEDEESE